MKTRLPLFLFILSLFFVSAATAETTKITRTSPNHTEIVIHDNSPEAQARRDQQVRSARSKLAEVRREKAQRQQVQRTSNRQQRGQVAQLESIRDRQKANEYKPPSFFNGGRFTGYSNFGFGYGFPAYGYGYGYNGYGYNGYGYAPIYTGYNRGYYQRAPRITRY